MDCDHLFKDGICQRDNCGYVSMFAPAKENGDHNSEQEPDEFDGDREAKALLDQNGD